MKTKLIAEIGCNHNGSIEIAERMIDQAMRLGCWGVKFQKRDMASIPEDVGNKPRDPATSFGKTYLEHRQALEFSIDQLERLRKLAKSKGLAFGVTAFDEASLEQLREMDLDFLKIPSQLYLDGAMNDHLLERKGKGPLIMASTGMHTYAEVLGSPNFGKHDVTMYCRSIYPCPSAKVNLSQMISIRSNLFMTALGYSSHDKNGEVIPWAVVLGAKYVERHFTLNKMMKGSDHGTVSSDPEEMEKIIRDIEYAEKLLGESFTELDDEEKKVRKIYRGF